MWIQPIVNQEQSGRKVCVKNMDRGLFFCHCSLDIQYSNCIDNIDNVLGVIGNPERMLRIREDVGGLYANVMPFYERV